MPASEVATEDATVDDLDSREVSGAIAEPLIAVESVVVSDTNALVVLVVFVSDTNSFVVLVVVVSDTNSFVVLVVVESDAKVFVVPTSLAESVALPILLLLVLEETAAADTGAKLTVVVKKSAEVNFAIVVLATTAKNSPETL